MKIVFFDLETTGTDVDNDKIVVTGKDFDFGPGPLTVTLGDLGLIDAAPVD